MSIEGVTPMRRFGWVLILLIGLCLSLTLTLTTHSRLGTIASALVTVTACGASAFLRAKGRSPDCIKSFL